MCPEQSSGKIGKSVGERLRAARMARHFTQSQLAAPDFSVSYISAIERGQIHPSLRALEILANRLGLPPAQLLPVRSQQEEQHSSGSSSISEVDNDEIELVLLEAEVQIRQNVAAQTLAELENLAAGQLTPAQQLRRHYLLGRAYYKVGRFQECDYVLAEAIQGAKDTHDALIAYFFVRTLHLQALAQAAMRNYAQALSIEQRCLSLLESLRPSDPFFTAQVYMHTGQHYTCLENPAQAITMFGKALALIESLAAPEKMQDAYWQLCQQHARAGVYELALLYAMKCTQLYHQRMQRQLASELYYYLGKAVIEAGEEQTGIFFAKISGQNSMVMTQDSLVQASIQARRAEWELRQQRFETAHQYIRRACELADPVGDTLIGADAHVLYGHIAYARQQYEEGDRHFATGLDMLERLHCHEELANESARYAELLEQTGKVHEAFSYFRRAFQSRQELGK
ncbi:MAG: helix-turn-helix transcriptional regulator [Ktedonobacteraceae bacterium]|nr:helix-turn-helix transcriptional regulator [Ktedonobacteraceae bacterium]